MDRETMPNRKRISIGCPHYREFVTGSYECDAEGNYILPIDGELDLARAKCGQRGSLCNQTLCALNRYNRRGKGTWYPTEILAESSGAQPTPPKPHQGNDLF